MTRKAGVKEPIRDKEKIQEIKNWLLVNKSYRDYLLFYLGINSGLRIGDLVGLKVSQVRNRNEIRIIQDKTEKEVVIPMNQIIQNEINKYCKDKADSDYLFPSKKGGHITTRMADHMFRDMANTLKIENWGTHSMRKTFGYFYYKKTNDVYYLMKLFGHLTQSQTLSYIGIELDEIRDSLSDFAL